MVGGPPPTIHPRASDRTQVSRAALAVLPARNFYRRYLRIVNRNLAIAHSDPLQGIAERDLPEPPPRPIRSCIAFPGSPCASAFPPARSVRPRPAFRPIEASRPRVGYVRNTSTPDMSLRETERDGAHALANRTSFSRCRAPMTFVASAPSPAICAPIGKRRFARWRDDRTPRAIRRAHYHSCRQRLGMADRHPDQHDRRAEIRIRSSCMTAGPTGFRFPSSESSRPTTETSRIGTSPNSRASGSGSARRRLAEVGGSGWEALARCRFNHRRSPAWGHASKAPRAPRVPDMRAAFGVPVASHKRR